ncbi:MAG TPA: hypothetical protein VH143_17190 [Kofleriaceae bacterium]|nr:hypothetical protein [Kofleriaceae bacterium]
MIRRWNLFAALLMASCWTAQTPPVDPQQATEATIPADCKPATRSRAGDIELTTCSVAHGGEAEWRAYLVQPGRVDPLDEPNARAVAVVGALAGSPVVFVKMTGTDGREAMQIWRLPADAKSAPSLAGTFDGKTAELAIDDRGAVIKTCDDACAGKSVRWVDGALVVEDVAAQ